MKSSRERWSRDETILALHLYMTNGRTRLGADSSEVTQYLKRHERLGFPIRSPDSIEMKTMNFVALDPNNPNKGFEHHNTFDQEAWDEFAHSPQELSREVTRIIEDRKR